MHEIEIPKVLLREVLNSVEGGPFLYRREDRDSVVFMNHEDHIEIWIRQDSEFFPLGIISKEQLRIVARSCESLRQAHSDSVKFTAPKTKASA